MGLLKELLRRGNTNKSGRNQLGVFKVSVTLRLRDLWSDVLGVSGHLMDRKVSGFHTQSMYENDLES